MMNLTLGGLTISGDGSTPYLLRDFDPGEHTLRIQDIDAPLRGGSIPGRDYDASRVWAITAQALGRSEGDTLDLVGAMASVWRPDALERPGVTVPLSYAIGGHQRRVYGRPERFVGPPVTGDGRLLQGVGEMLATFRVTDALHYSETPTTLPMTIVPSSGAGLRFPTRPPFTWSKSGGAPMPRAITVGGDARTPLTVTFNGPIARPWVQVGGVRIALTSTLAYDESITVNARTLSVTRADGAAVPGALSPLTRLADLRVAPGTHEVTFGGVDVTGTATATVSFRSAWRSL